VTEGWFVVNARAAAWLTSDAFGDKCVFEADKPVVRNRPELDVHRFAQVGVALRILQPGRPSGLYHAESNQEDFLVLGGECLLIVEGNERRLNAWDFVHCPRTRPTCSSAQAPTHASSSWSAGETRTGRSSIRSTRRRDAAARAWRRRRRLQ
jgi:quercetin dioxygenase-like cupin family protein